MTKKRKCAVLCAICLEQCTPLAVGVCTLSCHHTFHTDCIQVWFVEKKECPVCRGTDISCNHGTSLVEHPITTVLCVLETVQAVNETLKKQCQEMSDTILALRVQQNTSDYLLSIVGFMF